MICAFVLATASALAVTGFVSAPAAAACAPDDRECINAEVALGFFDTPRHRASCTYLTPANSATGRAYFGCQRRSDRLNVGMGPRGRTTTAPGVGAYPRQHVIAYGRRFKRGPFACVLRRATGLTCHNLAKHGFRLTPSNEIVRF
jgi:hypothetical protein